MSSLLSQSCEFVKKRDDTVLRVVWNGDLHLLDKGPKRGSARRWLFTINGQECKEPKTIDTQIYIIAKGTDLHRPAYGGWAYRVLIHTYIHTYIHTCIHTYIICFIYNIQNTILLLLLLLVVVVVVVMVVAAAAAVAVATVAVVGGGGRGGGGGSGRAL